MLDLDQFNMTNKFMNLFMRYNYHFSNCKIDYDLNSDEMQMYIGKPKFNDDNIINQIDYNIEEFLKEREFSI